MLDGAIQTSGFLRLTLRGSLRSEVRCRIAPDVGHSAATARKLIARIGELAKLRFPIHPPMLRHSAGYKLANEGHDTRSIQQYLGHRKITHTARYTELSPERLRSDQEGDSYIRLGHAFSGPPALLAIELRARALRLGRRLAAAASKDRCESGLWQ